MKNKQKTENEQPCYIRSDGLKLKLRPISMVELGEVERGIKQDYLDAGEPIFPPTYSVSVAGGGKKEFPITKDNLVVEGDEEETARRQKAWREHLAALKKLNDETGEITSQIIFEGVDFGEIPEEWIAKKRKRHIRIPEDEDELRVMYVLMELLKSPEDIMRCQQEIILISSSGAVDREAVEAAGDTFLRTLQEEAKRSSGGMDTSGGNEEEPA